MRVGVIGLGSMGMGAFNKKWAKDAGATGYEWLSRDPAVGAKFAADPKCFYADAAKVLIEQGCDVILQHTDSTAPQAAAQAAGNVYTFGQASDMGEYAPMPRVSSIIDNWAPYYVERTQAVMDGTWTSVDTWDGIGRGMVGIGEISDAVPADVKASAEALRDSIASGAYHPFTGPLNKQDGSAWLAEGETADDGTLAGLNFYVEGIDGDIPS